MRQRTNVTRTTLLLAVFLTAWHAARLKADEVPHVRPASTRERETIDQATRYSPTVRRLIDEIDRSDVFVYVQLTGSPQVPTASTTFTVATPRGRYLRILISVGTPVWARAQVLAHELQHVLEVASAPGVSSNAGIRRLYERIGRASGAPDRFETAEAARVEGIVRAEMARFQKLTGVAAQR